MKLNSTSPLNQNKNLTHLLNYNDEPLNNNTFITPPPDVDMNTQQQQQQKPNPVSKKRKKSQPQNTFMNKDYYSSSTRKSQVLPTPQHIDPYTQTYHPFDSRTPPFFNFPFANPFMNPHPTSTHYHHNPMKYHYPTHQQQFSYHPHLQRQQQYNNPNYMRKF